MTTILHQRIDRDAGVCELGQGGFQVAGEAAFAEHPVQGFLGPRAMRTLGLAYVPPWYPLLRIPVNVTRSVAALTLPGGMERAVARGEREQETLLHTMIGDSEATIGDSAAHVTRVA